VYEGHSEQSEESLIGRPMMLCEVSNSSGKVILQSFLLQNDISCGTGGNVVTY